MYVKSSPHLSANFLTAHTPMPRPTSIDECRCEIHKERPTRTAPEPNTLCYVKDTPMVRSFSESKSSQNGTTSDRLDSVYCWRCQMCGDDLYT